jgi:riboflavin synthase
VFTGIVEAVGEVARMAESSADAYRLEVSTALASQIQIGDSLSNNGACLTVVAKKPGAVEFDLLAETAARTNLKDLKIGSLINLERSMPASGRFDGHFVQGHVDSTAAVLESGEAGQGHRVEIALPEAFQQYVVFKGSIAVNGISLTVSEVHANSFVVWIIPHTWKVTNLHCLGPGAQVNLEFDLVAKYVERMLQQSAFFPATAP